LRNAALILCVAEKSGDFAGFITSTPFFGNAKIRRM
jgi:hypothetical protein